MIIEKKAEIQLLLKGFLIDAMRDADEIRDKMTEQSYDMVIWNAERSSENRAKIWKVLNHQLREAPQTQIVIISHDEGEPALTLFNGCNCHFIHRPIDRTKFRAFVN